MRRGPSPSADREGIYRYDEAPDVRIKRILNYEAPYPVADRVLSGIFTRHLGDSARLRARAVSVGRPDSRDGAGRHDVRLSHRKPSGAVAARRRARSATELRNGPRLVADLTGQQPCLVLLSLRLLPHLQRGHAERARGVRLFDGVQHGPARDGLRPGSALRAAAVRHARCGACLRGSCWCVRSASSSARAPTTAASSR